MTTAVDPGEVPHLLRKALGRRWDLSIAADHVQIRHQDHGKPYRPPGHALAWPDLLARLEAAFAEQGVPRAPCLPLRWGRETELTISAIQAFDPVLKDGRTAPYRQGFIPQPVVRLTGKRAADGTLLDGFLTSFVNASRVELLPDLPAYAASFDQLLTVLSRLSLHARHITFHGKLAIWRRRQVEGITLRFDHAGTPLGDLVLLWNAAHPDRLVLDTGTSLERLAWTRSRASWHELIFGTLAGAAPHNALDALRTATLLLANGITPAARGAGSVTRRVLQHIPPDISALGSSRAVRHFHQYWQGAQHLAVSWHAVVAELDERMPSRCRGSA